MIKHLNNCVVQVFSLRTGCRTKCMPQQEFMMFQIAFGIFFLFIHNFQFIGQRICLKGLYNLFINIGEVYIHPRQLRHNTAFNDI
jgi:hypothetical protein